MISPAAERRLLQCVVAAVCAVPFAASLAGIALGAKWLAPGDAHRDLDSHFRYLSGIFLGLGLGFASCVPGIERHGARLRLLGAMVVLGGLARLWSFHTIGAPSIGHRVGLGIELGVVPLVILWQTRVARRFFRANPVR